jgi:hypothetical protein
MFSFAWLTEIPHITTLLSAHCCASRATGIFFASSHRLFTSTGERWLNLVEKHAVVGKNAHDARIVAAMLRHNVVHLLTFNSKDFQRYSEIVASIPDEAAINGLPTERRGSFRRVSG